jgi:hypothetical protein
MHNLKRKRKARPDSPFYRAVQHTRIAVPALFRIAYQRYLFFLRAPEYILGQTSPHNVFGLRQVTISKAFPHSSDKSFLCPHHQSVLTQ